MKKVLTLTFVVALLISACGQSAPTTISAPEVTEVPANTSVPEVTVTPESSPTPEASPTPEMLDPYAIISADKAEFWFPLPQREWQWFVIPKENNRVYEESSWSIRFEVDKAYEIYVDITNNENLPPQKGNLAEMLQAAGVNISELGNIDSNCFSDICYFTGFENVSVTSVDNGLLIELTEQSLVQALNQNKPETIRFSYQYMTDYNADPKQAGYEADEIEVTPTYK